MNTTLITGASGGIGEVFARKLAARGENVLLVARSEERLATVCNELARAHDVNAQYVALDLSRDDAAARLFDETMKRGLSVETLINNAGFGSMGEFASLDMARELFRRARKAVRAPPQHDVDVGQAPRAQQLYEDQRRHCRRGFRR